MFQKFIIIFTIIFTFNIPCSSSISFIPANNITFFGDANLIINSATNLSSISLTQQNPSSSGRAFYFYPLQFLDHSTNSSVSFFSRFSFIITPSSPSNPGDGIAFLITSDLGLFSSKFGHLGLPEFSLNSQESFFAVEFDTKFDALVGDVNDNHVGIDVNSDISLVSVDGFWVELI
uniref:Legume lectin domain-containing protein n=1 Tax=Chenopodium quinoa TaxID=63459 RepID=A0A803LHS1_CHEQI